MSTEDKPNLHYLRVSYELGELNDEAAPDAPLELFQGWLQDALTHQLPEPNAMSLATTGLDGSPNIRTVLLKGVDAKGFSFFTNYDSTKGQEILAHPRGALCFLWTTRQRQVTVRGPIVKLSRAEAETYFALRPYGNQIGAWASTQSAVIPDRAWLEERTESIRALFPEGQPVPCPENWGGYALQPEEMEFWQGRRSRLHDRLKYRLDNGVWTRERLSP
ncbi:MAG: pyridoxamine 5-phosphate oxidase [Verrucomicrobiaceae bacterium]|nr:pyridoxamine 5-phosphate oxidase [Verrucomicrobiaceae bacterium]